MTLREGEPGDTAFITSSWLQSFASSDVALNATPKDDRHTVACPACKHRTLRSSGAASGITRVHAGEGYWGPQRRLIERLLASCNVAVEQNEDGLIDGWVVREWRRPVVHYFYVRASARGRGVSRVLLADLRDVAMVYTHKPRGLETSRLPANWTYSDYFLKGVDHG